MICRVAAFEGEPERFTAGHAYRYVLDAISPIEGFRGAYHLVGESEALSVSFWDDEDAMRRGEAAVATARQRLDLEGSPPTRVTTYRVASAAEPSSNAP